jgi:pyridoxine/pyridoxamine 5'-phosphate oxidase
MTKEFIYSFIKQHRLAVVSTVSKDSKPEAALVGFAVSKNLEIVFDTVTTSRKYKNLLQNPFIAAVIGWDNETTVQLEGTVTELKGEYAGYYKEIYFEVYPDGRERAETWPDIAHFKITASWIRYSNFNENGVIEEMKGPF